jgi:hypothetical protein
MSSSALSRAKIEESRPDRPIQGEKGEEKFLRENPM